ncbi:hypothetical protein AGMMS49940_04230 [Spirochaetia bacterium]|nr:hypothetical protein AGMMS49940_04230 [Spirochaetia bacterium]
MPNWYSHQLSFQELKQFIDEARNGKENKKAFIGTVESAAAMRIKAVCGEDVTSIMLESSSIRHSHGKIHHNLEDDDLLHLVDTINSATDIKLSPKKSENNKVLEFKKNINGEITFVEEVRINHGGWLSLVTCYRLKKQRRGDAPRKR